MSMAALIREAIDATVEQHAPKPRSLGVGASEPLVIPSPVLVEVDYWIGQRLTFGQALDADGLTWETVDIGGSSDDYRFDGLGIAVGGIFAGRLALSAIYPLGASLALAHAPGTPVRASARLTAASGVAILSAPLALGFVAGSVGVWSAWLIVLGLLGMGLLVVLRIPAPPTALDHLEVATAG
jgi:MFS family permease